MGGFPPQGFPRYRRIDINVAQWGGNAQTGFDFEDHIPFIAAHRFKTIRYVSGEVTVTAGSYTTTLSVTGIGYMGTLECAHKSTGIGAGNASHTMLVDGGAEESFIDFGNLAQVSAIKATGLDTVGWHLNKVYVWTWDTVNNIYRVSALWQGKLQFRTSLECRLRNYDTVDSTQKDTIDYSLFTSSKRIVIKLPRFVGAVELRQMIPIRRHPIIVQRLGYFDVEERHPYYEYLSDLPNRWDREIRCKNLEKFKAHIAGRESPDDLAIIERGGIVRSATERVQNFVAEIYGPENWTADEILGRIKPTKVLYEEVM